MKITTQRPQRFRSDPEERRLQEIGWRVRKLVEAREAGDYEMVGRLAEGIRKHSQDMIRSVEAYIV